MAPLKGGGAVGTLGCVDIVPLDLVGDEWSATASAASRQGATFLSHTGCPLARLIERQSNLPKCLLGLLLQPVGFRLVALLAQGGSHPGKDRRNPLGATSTDEESQRLPGVVQRRLDVGRGKASARRLKHQVSNTDEHASLSGLPRQALEYVGCIGKALFHYQAVSAGQRATHARRQRWTTERAPVCETQETSFPKRGP